MAGYLLPFESEVPLGVSCEAVADAVFEKMKSPEAINDLSLPDPSEYSWAPATPTVRPKFILHTIPNHPSRTLESCTSISPTSDEIICNVFYTAAELAECPDIIESRLAHELTHGIRTRLIKSTVKMHAITDSPFWNSTPPKHPRERMFKSRFLLHMNSPDNSFESGYWMEHFLHGGVLVSLSGSYFTDRKDPEGSWVKLGHDKNIYFKLITTGFHIYLDTKPRADTFTQLVGYLYDANTRTFSSKTEIFHSYHARFCRTSVNGVKCSEYV